MLFILADVYRIATLRSPDPPVRYECNWQTRDKDRRWRWFSIAGLRL